MINIRIQTSEVQTLSPKITVLGVGGAGGNAVNNMISSYLEGCEFVVCNTDSQALDGSLCENKIQLGTHVTGGLGAGANPEIGKQAAEESLEEVLGYLEGANMAFVTAGMGGGTGTGAAPVIAKACRDAGILTVGVVTKPFHFEGTHRMKMAEAGIMEMQSYVDTLIVIPNQNLFRIANEKTTFAEAFKMADSVLQSGVRGVTDLMVMPGLINLDFADIRSAMLEMGKAMMGTGEAEGERRAIDAAEAAINNPLLDDVSMKGARGVIINVTGGHDMTLFEVDEACNRIRDEVDPNANIIFGSTFDDKLEGQMRVSVVATGIDVAEGKKTRPSGVRVTPLKKPQPEKVEVEQKLKQQAPVQRPQSAYMAQTPQTFIPRRTTQPMVQAHAVEEPESDLFEQQEFGDVQGAQPAQASQAPAYNPNIRSSRYGDSFIPPAPVVPERQDPVPVNNFAPRIIEQPQPQQQQPDMQGQSFSLRPPVPGQNSAERKKSPSLFERITGGIRDYANMDQPQTGEQVEGESSSASGSAGSFHGGLRAPQRPSQGQLNIDSPHAEPQKQEGDLDIPAFLRRQAN